MTEDWSCLSQQDTDPYTQICKEAVEDDNKFLAELVGKDGSKFFTDSFAPSIL